MYPDLDHTWMSIEVSIIQLGSLSGCQMSSISTWFQISIRGQKWIPYLVKVNRDQVANITCDGVLNSALNWILYCFGITHVNAHHWHKNEWMNGLMNSFKWRHADQKKQVNWIICTCCVAGICMRMLNLRLNDVCTCVEHVPGFIFCVSASRW